MVLHIALSTHHPLLRAEPGGYPAVLLGQEEPPLLHEEVAVGRGGRAGGGRRRPVGGVEAAGLPPDGVVVFVQPLLVLLAQGRGEGAEAAAGLLHGLHLKLERKGKDHK